MVLKDLYGRNTIAGAIKINSADRGENGGNFAVSVGDEGYRKVKVGLVMVLMTHLALSFLHFMRRAMAM